MAQSAKGLQCKPEDLSWIPEHRYKAVWLVLHAVIPALGRQREGPYISLDIQVSSN